MKWKNPDRAGSRPWQKALFQVIFLANTRSGKAFDEVLLVAILLSVGTVMLESIESFRTDHGRLLQLLEWTFTVLFTVEYVLRLLCVRRPVRYATSFFGNCRFPGHRADLPEPAAVRAPTISWWCVSCG